MNADASRPSCQIKAVHHIADGPQDAVPFGRSVRLLVRQILGPRMIRTLRRHANNFMNWSARRRGLATKPASKPLLTPAMLLKAGDQVRVRSKDEIEATLNHWGQLKGCSFAPEMVQYCDTTQKVLKPVVQFVDERDLRLRKTKGIVLLDGMICQGTSSLGRCDRNCLYFWRVEWLEKIESV